MPFYYLELPSSLGFAVRRYTSSTRLRGLDTQSISTSQHHRTWSKATNANGSHRPSGRPPVLAPRVSPSRDHPIDLPPQPRNKSTPRLAASQPRPLQPSPLHLVNPTRLQQHQSRLAGELLHPRLPAPTAGLLGPIMATAATSADYAFSV